LEIRQQESQAFKEQERHDREKTDLENKFKTTRIRMTEDHNARVHKLRQDHSQKLRTDESKYLDLQL
jgi:hypothetical protein